MDHFINVFLDLKKDTLKFHFVFPGGAILNLQISVGRNLIINKSVRNF